MESFWEKVKYQVKKTLPDHCYRMWIDPVRMLEFNDQTIKLSSPNAYFIKRLKDNYLPMLQEEFSRLGYEDLNIKFKVTATKNPLKNNSKNLTSNPALTLQYLWWQADPNRWIYPV